MKPRIDMLYALCLLVLAAATGAVEGGSFKIEEDRFVLDGEPIQLISGR